MGAWIEIIRETRLYVPVKVAPYMGAWIEIQLMLNRSLSCVSHPTWVRGLK